ncbi:MAG: glycosyltransferase family 4 protein [Armatimonadota bacterium]
MKVVIITDYTYVNGGAGKVALESAVALASQVDHVYVFSAVGEIPESLNSIENLTVVSLGQKKITEVAARKAIISGLWNRPAEVAFRELLGSLDTKDTVVHIHSWRDALTASPISVAIELGFRVVMTCHDFGLACPLAGFYDARNRSICSERGLGIGCLTKSCTNGSFTKKSWFVARHAIQVRKGKVPTGVKHFIFVSEFSKQIIDSYLPPSAICHYVDNPIGAARLERSNPAGSKHLVYIGRFSDEKGPDLAAAAAFQAKAPIKFVGTGGLADRILEVNPEAELMGWRKPTEVTEILRSARALVFPSVWYETQGMVVNEAAANGIPVIVSDCTAAVDTVRKLGHGVTFKAGSIESLVAKIKEYESDDFVSELGARGYDNYWKCPPTIDFHTAKLLEVYSAVLSD